MAKFYTANTPLILEDDGGKEYRVEAGEAVALSPEQYESVAAHVTPVQTASEPEMPSESGETDGQDDTPSENGSQESGSDTPPETKPARGAKGK